MAGQEFIFPGPLLEAAPFMTNDPEGGAADNVASIVLSSFLYNQLVSRTEGWVANSQRVVEIWSAPNGLVVRTEGGSDFTISLDGKDIRCASHGQDDGELNETDRQILLGPVIVLALALRGTWSMHASATLFNDNLVLFLGESGQGKSTLAGYLANQAGWRLVADDILPVTIGAGGVLAWPHFPQLKLPTTAQPSQGLPEQLPINKVCILTDAALDDIPELQPLAASEGIQVFLGHTAGTRLFTPDLLTKHLAFCSQAAEQVPVFRLTYPHRGEALGDVKELLEKIC